jgi:hypothetical protein
MLYLFSSLLALESGYNYVCRGYFEGWTGDFRPCFVAFALEWHSLISVVVLVSLLVAKIRCILLSRKSIS